MAIPKVSWGEVAWGIFLGAMSFSTWFVMPQDYLYQNGRRHFGDIYLGLSELFGPLVVRYLAGLPFALMAWFTFRRAFRPAKPDEKD